jgi:Zn-dependent protease
VFQDFRGTGCRPLQNLSGFKAATFMSNSPEESNPAPPSEVPLSVPVDPPLTNSDIVVEVQSVLNAPAIVATQVTYTISDNDQELKKVQRRLEQLQAAQFFAWRRRHLRTSALLFFLTLLSTFLVGSRFFPLEYLLGWVFPRFGTYLQQTFRPHDLDLIMVRSCRQGLEYAVPLMSILFFHEMGHYLQSVWNRVPASLPYFIPMPIPPMGTMGAVIFQGRGVATRRQMFDIAVWGPLAGLAVTIPVLWYGLSIAEYSPRPESAPLQFSQPLLIKWMITAIHGPAPEGCTIALDDNGIAFAGWVGVLITAMNLLPVGQLDGGHILYTLIGRKAHFVAYAVILCGFGYMVINNNFSFSLLLLLLMMTGIKHPPTANDQEKLGLARHILGWSTLSFLLVGLTMNPITVPELEDDNRPEEAVEVVSK